MRNCFTIAAIALVWLRVLSHLAGHWSSNEQYSYGWAVPFLCLFLAWKAVGNFQQFAVRSIKDDRPLACFFTVLCFGALLILLAARWVGEANADWRLVSWVMALAAVGFTLAFARLTWGAQIALRLAFPLFFFLIAVPWPTPIEHPLIQTLTLGIVKVTTELLNIFGIAAIASGNLIETAGGVVDIDRACSGIRSLQAALMLALFFGDMFRLTVLRRVALAGLALALACVFNLARTFILSCAASQRGSIGVRQWHEPAGTAILVGCFLGVWAFSMFLRQKTGPVNEPQERLGFLPRPSTLSLRVAGATLLIILTGEVFIHTWYATAPRLPIVEWTATLPTNNSTFHPVALVPATVKILRFNEDQCGRWQNNDGSRWQLFYFRWLPGRTAVHLARSHTPDICLPAAGRKLHGTSDVAVIARGMTFPFRCYVAGEGLRRLYVFYSLWEDGAAEQVVTARMLDRRSRMEAVLQRRRNPGQRVIQIALTGPRDQAHAVQLLRTELPNLIRR